MTEGGGSPTHGGGVGGAGGGRRAFEVECLQPGAGAQQLPQRRRARRADAVSWGAVRPTLSVEAGMGLNRTIDRGQCLQTGLGWNEMGLDIRGAVSVLNFELSCECKLFGRLAGGCALSRGGRIPLRSRAVRLRW